MKAITLQGRDMKRRRTRTTPAEARLNLDKWDRKPWKESKYRGRTILQTPVDLWLFSELLDRLRPGLIVELGVHASGFSLWLHDQTRIRSMRTWILGIDRKLPDLFGGQIVFPSRFWGIQADTLSVEALDFVRAKIQRIDDHGIFESVGIDAEAPRLFILDDDHDPAHVIRKLEAWGEFCRPGDWLIVCETIRVVGLEMAVRTWTSGRQFAVSGIDRFGLSNHRSGWLRRKVATSIS